MDEIAAGAVSDGTNLERAKRYLDEVFLRWENGRAEREMDDKSVIESCSSAASVKNMGETVATQGDILAKPPRIVCPHHGEVREMTVRFYGGREDKIGRLCPLCVGIVWRKQLAGCIRPLADSGEEHADA